MDIWFRALSKFACGMALAGIAHGSSYLVLDDQVKSAESIDIVNIERGSESGRKVFQYGVSKSRTIAGKDHGKGYCIRSRNILKIGGTYLFALQASLKVSPTEPGCKTQFDDTDARSLVLEVIQKSGSYFVVYSDIDVIYPRLKSVEIIRQCDLRDERTDVVIRNRSADCEANAETAVLGSVVPLTDFVEHVQTVRERATPR